MRIFNISYEMLTAKSFIHKSFMAVLNKDLTKEELDSKIRNVVIRQEGNEPRNVGRVWYSELPQI